VVKVLTPPKPEKRKVDPFSEDHVRALLSALGRSKVYTRPGGKNSDHELGHEDRNRAMIMVLLDTGLRATELCDLLIEDLDVRNGRLRVKNGKGDKERYVPFSSRTGQALWKYMARRKEPRPDEPVFVTRNERALTRTELAHTLKIIGDRAQVSDVHPHRFRHTFAINFLRNGGDAYSLQEILGHSTMEMVKLYLKLAESDIAASHRRASPVDHWRL
jgi:site-specific recombinase XerD